MGIYKIESKIKLERIYIGSAANINNRWSCHIKDLRKNKHGNKKLQNHYNKYSESDLQFSILLGCNKIDLVKIEQYYIDSYNPWFNICKIAGSPIGVKRSIETKNRMSDSRKGIKNHNFGKSLSLEVRQKISNSHKGKLHPHKGYVHSKETKQKLSNSLKGRTPWNKGKPNPCYHPPHSEEQKIKIGNASRGRRHTEESKKKMSDIKTNYYKSKHELLFINQN